MLRYSKLAGRLAFLAACTSTTATWAATTGDNGSHDPSRMLSCDGNVYIYSSVLAASGTSSCRALRSMRSRGTAS